MKERFITLIIIVNILKGILEDFTNLIMIIQTKIILMNKSKIINNKIFIIKKLIIKIMIF